MSTLFLCGAGNSEGVRLARHVGEYLHRWDRLVLLDDDPRKIGGTLLGVPIAGPIDALASAPPGSEAVNLVARTTAGRAAVHRRIAATGVPFANLVHPAVDARDCELGRGVLVYEQAILSPETRVGDGAVVFMRAIVGHEANVAGGCVVAAGSVLNARVAVGERVYVGSNASVLPEVRIGADATVGANTMVLTDVPAGATVLGVPGRILDRPATAPSPTALAAGDGAVDTVLEARLLGILQDVLGRRDVRADDNFFELGGTSLRAIRFLTLVHDELHVDVPLTVLYARCTARSLARHLGEGEFASDPIRVARSRALARRRLVTGATGP